MNKETLSWLCLTGAVLWLFIAVVLMLFGQIILSLLFILLTTLEIYTVYYFNPSFYCIDKDCNCKICSKKVVKVIRPINPDRNIKIIPLVRPRTLKEKLKLLITKLFKMKKLFIIICMILPFIGSSQIAYTNSNDVVALSMADLPAGIYSKSYNIDIDADGQRDFAFNIQKGSLSGVFKSITISKDALYNNAIQTIVTGSPLGSNPCTDVMIDMENLSVCPGTDIPSPYTNMPIGTSGYYGGTTIKFEQQNLHGGDISLYLGVRFQRIHPISGNLDTHYGYIHIGLGANEALVIHSYAWNPVPNACIIADDYNLTNSGIICTQNVNVPVYDTIVTQVYDTNIVTTNINDTTFFNVPVNVNIYDTIPFNIPVYDTITTVSVDTSFYTDTTLVNLGTYLDTMNVTIVDTNWVNQGTYLDTLTIIDVDLGTYSDTIPYIDTITTVLIDTVINIVYDTLNCDDINPVPPPTPDVSLPAFIISDDIDLEVYPNPAIDILNIKNFDSFASYTIIDLLGKSENIYDQEVFISHLSPGFYVLKRVSQDGSVSSIKFNKQ